MTTIDKIARYVFLTVLWGVCFLVGGSNARAGNYTELVTIGLFVAGGILSSGAAWRPTDAADKLARYGFLVGLWSVMGLFTLYVTSSLYATSGFQFISLNLVAAFGGVLAASINLFPRYGLGAESTQAEASETSAQPDHKAKRKNEQTAGLSPLDILTPEDLYELREDIKAELRARILSGSDGELSSLDALLAGQDAPRKTAKK